MNKLLVALFCLICLNSYPQDTLPSVDQPEYDVSAFYSVVTPATGTKALSDFGELTDVKTLLVPLQLNQGDYSITVTRKGSDLYLIDNKNIYIETKFCYEQCVIQKATLKVESQYGLYKGKLVFDKSL
jgi:hypothetical protein